MLIETSRLLLRCFTLDDIPAMAALYADPIVMASKGGIRPYGYAEHTVKECIQDYESVGYSFWAAIHRENGTLIGLCGLLNQEIEGRPEVEIAYTFAKEYWNQGLATEAAQACQRYGLEQFGITRFVSLIAPDNIPSQRVALKNGMYLEKDIIDEKGRATRVYATRHRALLEEKG